MSMATVNTSEIREIERRLGVKGRRVFTIKGWNNSLREAGITSGNWWLANYAPLRWNSVYAVQNLGYPASSRKRSRMARGEPPFYRTGDFQTAFIARARTVAVAKGGSVRFAIVAPAGWLSAHPKEMQSFRTVPPREKAAVAREFRRALIQAVQTGRAAHVAKQQAAAAARLAKKQASEARRVAYRSNRSKKSTRKEPP